MSRNQLGKGGYGQVFKQGNVAIKELQPLTTTDLNTMLADRVVELLPSESQKQIRKKILQIDLKEKDPMTTLMKNLYEIPEIAKHISRADLRDIVNDSIQQVLAPEEREQIFIVEATTCKYLTKTYTINCLTFDFRESSYTMELGINIRDYVKLGDKQVKSAVEGVVASVSYMHSQGLLHLDIKPDNILVVENRVKLIDFGVVKYISNTFILPNMAFTLAYRPPELFTDYCRLHESLDIWATGITLLELTTGKNPFSEKQPKTLTGARVLVKKFAKTPRTEYPSIAQMLNLKPLKRTLDGSNHQALDTAKVNVKYKDFEHPIIMAKAIGFMIDTWDDNNLDFHILYLAVKILYSSLDVSDDIMTLICVCLRLGEILTNPSSLRLSYRKLIEYSDYSTTRHLLSKTTEQVLKALDYDVRVGDAYLYLLEKQVQEFYKKNAEPKDDPLESFFVLMLYNVKFFEYDPKGLFQTFIKIQNTESLNTDEVLVLKELKTTLLNFDKHYASHVKDSNLFSKPFRQILTERDL